MRDWYFISPLKCSLALLCASLLCLAGLVHGQDGKLFTPPDKPTRIGIQVIVIDLDGIDSSQQTFTANVAMVASWRDHRLAGTVTGPTVKPVSSVWHPQIQAANQQRLWKTMEPRVVVYPDGTVMQRQRVWGDFSQPLDLHDFPLDIQTFEIRLVAAGYGPDAVEFEAAEGRGSGIAERLSLADWEILSHRLDFEPYRPIAELRQVASAAFQFEAGRLRGYYILKIILPLMLIVGMSYLVFWLPLSQASTRISVSVTAMLTLIAYRFMIGGLLPKVSYMTRLDNFIMLSTVLVFGTLLVAGMTGAWEESKPDRASRLNRTALAGFPLLFLLVGVIAFGL